MTDRQIRHRLDRNELMARNTWDAGSLRHASYTLRLGERIEVERASDARRDQRQRSVMMLRQGGEPLTLEPGDTALLFSKEILSLPPDVMGFTVARGLLFVETLTPENTYVDPGFHGQLYTTVTNLSQRALRLHYGMPIARLFFYQLIEPVEHPYETGAARGVEQHLESQRCLPADGDPSKRAQADLLKIVKDVERAGPELGELMRRASRQSRNALIVAWAWPLVIWLATSNRLVFDALGPFLSGVLQTVVGGLVLVAVQKWLGSRK